LRPYVATLSPGTPIFPLPEKGVKMLRADLQAASIPYRDASGLFFDFHSLRCQTATLADSAGVSPRVVQKMMRHSTLELTGRYTRPRAVDIEAAASLLPSLKPERDRPEPLAATGTDPSPVSRPTATSNAPLSNADAFNSKAGNRVATLSSRTSNPKVVGSNPTGRAFRPLPTVSVWRRPEPCFSGAGPIITVGPFES